MQKTVASASKLGMYLTRCDIAKCATACTAGATHVTEVL